MSTLICRRGLGRSRDRVAWHCLSVSTVATWSFWEQHQNSLISILHTESYPCLTTRGILKLTLRATFSWKWKVWQLRLWPATSLREIGLFNVDSFRRTGSYQVSLKTPVLHYIHGIIACRNYWDDDGRLIMHQERENNTLSILNHFVSNSNLVQIKSTFYKGRREKRKLFSQEILNYALG